jgi:hypothetical protein
VVPQALTLPNAEDEKQMGATEGGRAWWRWQDTASSSRPSLSAQYSGWEEAYSGLLAALKEHHPIDGILGAWPASCLLVCSACIHCPRPALLHAHGAAMQLPCNVGGPLHSFTASCTTGASGCRLLGLWGFLLLRESLWCSRCAALVGSLVLPHLTRVHDHCCDNLQQQQQQQQHSKSMLPTATPLV